MASWLPSADTIKAPTLKNPDLLSSASHFSRQLYSLPWRHTTFPDPSFPPDERAEEHTCNLTHLAQDTTHLAEDIDLLES